MGSKSWRESTDPETLRTAVADLKRQVEDAHYRSDGDAAGEAHADLTSAEWRLRLAEARHG